MKILQIIVILFLSHCGLSQNRLDTTFQINKTQFRVKLHVDTSSLVDINSKVTFLRNNKVLLSDSIFCSSLYLRFKDMNKDGFKDILIYQSSGARANESYNLYLYRKSNDDFKKIIGFNDWPNLNTTEIKGVLAAGVLTGTVFDKFFRLLDSGKLIDLNIMEEDKNLDGKGYDKGLMKVKQWLKQAKQPTRRTT